MNSVDSTATHVVHFTVHYETQLGENIYILGDIPELGDWTELVCRCDWTEGNIWRKYFSLPRKLIEFNFKFVCVNEVTEEKRWEEGPNRTYKRVNTEFVTLACSWSENNPVNQENNENY